MELFLRPRHYNNIVYIVAGARARADGTGLLVEIGRYRAASTRRYPRRTRENEPAAAHPNSASRVYNNNNKTPSPTTRAPSPALRAYNNIIMYSNYFALLTAAAAGFIARRPVIAACVLWSAAAGRGGGGVSAPRLSPVWRLAADAKSPVNARNPCGGGGGAPYSGTHTRTHCTNTVAQKYTAPGNYYTAARWWVAAVSISQRRPLYSRVMYVHIEARRRRHYNIIYFFIYTHRLSCFTVVQFAYTTWRSADLLLHARARVSNTLVHVYNSRTAVYISANARALPSDMYTAAAFVPCRRAAAIAIHYDVPMRLTRLPVEFSRARV